MMRYINLVEEEMKITVRVPTYKQYLYEDNLEKAMERLAVKAYIDFTENIGEIGEMRKGKDFIDVYSKEKVIDKTVVVAYYLEQKSWDIFRGKYCYRYYTFTRPSRFSIFGFDF
mgnify:CR=1 FL=1